MSCAGTWAGKVGAIRSVVGERAGTRFAAVVCFVTTRSADRVHEVY